MVEVKVIFPALGGLKQGDLLSPLLFCLSENVLSMGFSKLVEDGRMHLISGPRGFKMPSHSFFAGDIMVFTKASKKSLIAILALLDDYASISGQVINKAKSTIFPGFISARRRSELVSWMGFQCGFLPFNYLGVPISKGQPIEVIIFILL